MTVTIHHWPYTLNSKSVGVGHVALELVSGSEVRYLSWYPKTEKAAASLIATSPVNHSREMDEAKNGPAPDIVVINGLNEGAMIAYIDSHRAHYSLFGSSCAQVVADALRAGGGAAYAPGATSLNPIWTPLTAADFARRIKREL